MQNRDAATSDKTQGHSKIDRTCCLSTSGFVEETGKCLPKKQECQRKIDKESSTRDPFHYDPAIYPKLRQHWCKMSSPHQVFYLFSWIVAVAMSEGDLVQDILGKIQDAGAR